MTISQKYLEFISLVQALNTIVFGGDTAEVTLDGITKPSISKFLAQVDALTTAELQRLRDAINVVMNQQSVPTTIVTDGTHSQEWINSDFRAALQALNDLIDTKGHSTLGADGKVDPIYLPQATETTLGVAKIATTAIAKAGVNDTDFITAKKLADTRKSVWSNKTGMLFGTTYVNSSLFDRDLSVISQDVPQGWATIRCVFIDLITLVETTVFFGSHANYSNPTVGSAVFTIPAKTSYKIDVVDTTNKAIRTATVRDWSERNYA